MRTPMRIRIAAAVAVLSALTLAGCADVVDGTGSEVQASSSGSTGSTDFPTDSSSVPSPTPTTPTTAAPSTSGTGSSPQPNFKCPAITYSSARMTFNCISNAMTVRTDGTVFSISMAQTVETTSKLQMEMGAKRYDGTATSFPAISSDVRLDMITKGYYGTDPEYDLDGVNYSTIDGHKAYTTIDTITFNPSWAASAKTAAKTEKRWLVIIQLDDGSYTLWYASIPDLAKQYWPQVPTAISSIKINE